MCLEGMLTSAFSRLPFGKYISGFISFLLLCAALFFAFQSQKPLHFLFACCCPILYLLYHFATKMTKKGKSKNNTSDNDSDT